jgi:glutamate N-acetyltransferase / amino-acid N-acetyltransferase
MAVGLSKKLPLMHAVEGIRLSATSAGIKASGRRDLVLIEICEQATSAAVFTRNAFCAAPVILSRKHMAKKSPRYLLINSGNANAGTGERGINDANSCCQALAAATGCITEEVLPFSTGVIGEPLPVAVINNGLRNAIDQLNPDGWHDAAHGIMTTDTVPKGVSRQITLHGKTITITGISKGSGMICPNMATMLAYIATDAGIEQGVLQRCLESAVAASFNCITVDGDTSTNDACVLIATGRSQLPQLQEGSEEIAKFQEAVTEVCIGLAQAIVRDGEGATKFITIEILQGADAEEVQRVAYTIANSPLVKTAFFASDPNWGRILAAVGRAGVRDLDTGRISIYLDEVCIARDGQRAREYQEQLGVAVMKRNEIMIRVLLGRGTHNTRIWTCDFSYEYVKINAEYRS